jgi:hypothetical protein
MRIRESKDTREVTGISARPCVEWELADWINVFAQFFVATFTR